MKSQQQNEGQPIVNSANNKKQEVGKGNVMRAPFKKYMTVKEVNRRTKTIGRRKGKTCSLVGRDE